jgi:hypothetical protein
MNNRTLRILVGIWVVLLFLCYVGAMWNMSDSIVREQKLEIQRLTSENDSLRIASDSLYSENFPCQVELGRYQVAYEIFMERNPKGAKQYGTIISEETE